MIPFDQLLEKDVLDYQGRNDEIIFQAPELYRLLTRILDDPRLPAGMRPLILVTIAYFALPCDIIPEIFYGPYGYIDDLFLSAFVADIIRKKVGSEDILTDNWQGDLNIIALIDDLLGRREELIGDKMELILKYIGYEFLAP